MIIGNETVEVLAVRLGFEPVGNNEIRRGRKFYRVYQDKHSGALFFTLRFQRILYRVYYHRFVMAFYNGDFGSRQIVHIDDDKHNNDLSNLRFKDELKNDYDSSLATDSGTGKEDPRYNPYKDLGF